MEAERQSGLKGQTRCPSLGLAPLVHRCRKKPLGSSESLPKVRGWEAVADGAALSVSRGVPV